MIWQMHEVNWRFNWDILLYLKPICEAVYKIFHLRALNGLNPMHSELDFLTSGICFKISFFY